MLFHCNSMFSLNNYVPICPSDKLDKKLRVKSKLASPSRWKVLWSWVQPANSTRWQVCPHGGFACIKKASNRNPAGTKYVAYATKLQKASGGCIILPFEKDCQLQKQGLSHLRTGKDTEKNAVIQTNPYLEITKNTQQSLWSYTSLRPRKGQTEGSLDFA